MKFGSLLLRFVLLSGFLACSLALAAPPAEVAGKIDDETWQKVESGEIRELLVAFDSSATDIEMKVRLAQRKLKIEDDAVLSLRAERYSQIKRSVDSALQPNDAKVLREYSHLPMRLVRFPDAAALLRMLKRPQVSAVMQNARAYPHLAQSLPLVGQPAVASVMGRTGAGTTVVVLDTGLTYTRSEFGSCTAPGVPAGCRVVAAFDAAPDDSALDANGHGTWVAGTVAGIAPGANIAAIDVFDGTSASSSDILEGINWAISNRTTYNIVAINLSLGDGVENTTLCSSGNPYRSAIINARNVGILTIASSGNDGYTDGISSPACTPEAVSVGAVYDANVGAVTWSACSDSSTVADKVTCFSNSASFLTLLAPGGLITVTGATVGGTSISAPFVSGAVAVMAQAFAADTATARLARLTGNGTAVTDTRNSIVTPRLNLLAAQGAPVNDPFASALILSGLSGQTTGWNINASKETGEPSHAGNVGGKSVWWKWTAPASGTLTVNTYASGFDTLLGIYTGSAVAALTTVASNDNDGSAGNTSGVSLTVQSGATYYFAVDGKAAVDGAITLNWSLLQAQTISFDAIADQLVNSSLTLSATASSGLAVSFSSQTASICTVTGDVVNFIAVGACTLEANQAGNAIYEAAPAVKHSFTVNKLAQSITDFQTVADQVLGATPFMVTATASSGLAVSITSLTPAVCTVSTNLVTLLNAGLCTLQASQEGDAFYLATSAQQGFNVTAPVAGNDGDVPIPLWALVLLGGGLLRGMLLSARKSRI